MDIQISGHQIDVGAALRTHVVDNLTAGVSKYFDRTTKANVTFSRERSAFKCETSLHLSSGIHLQSHGEAHEIYAAFEQACERLEKRLRRYKRRLKDHHAKAKDQVEPTLAPAYVIAASEETDEEPDDLNPVIIAETTHDIRTLTVGEAVMQLDLVDAGLLLFRNSAHGGLNVVYRRPDGNIGWVDPDGTERMNGAAKSE